MKRTLSMQDGSKWNNMASAYCSGKQVWWRYVHYNNTILYLSQVFSQHTNCLVLTAQNRPFYTIKCFFCLSSITFHIDALENVWYPIAIDAFHTYLLRVLLLILLSMYCASCATWTAVGPFTDWSTVHTATVAGPSRDHTWQPIGL